MYQKAEMIKRKFRHTDKMTVNTELNVFKIIICLRKIEVSVKRISICICGAGLHPSGHMT